MRERIAIIGGGIAGLYTAWRLSELVSDRDIKIYEATERIGGRIKTTDFGIRRKASREAPYIMRAELGAMRFPNAQRLIISLCEKLKFKNIDTTLRPDVWRGPFQLKSLYHLRGKTLADESFHRGEIPYRVRQEEQGKTQGDLLEYAVFCMLRKMIDSYAKRTEPEEVVKHKTLTIFHQKLKDHEVLAAADWMEFINADYEFSGIPLRNIGFWNVLKHFLSSEAFLLVHDGFGFLSVISNWNAPEAFRWLFTDFSPHLRLQTLPGGLSQLVEGIRSDLEKVSKGCIERDRELRSIHWIRKTRTFKLRFIDGGIVEAKRVVLALPPSALRRVRIFDGDSELEPSAEREWSKLIGSSRPHRLAKIVLAYEEPWWKHTPVPGAESGRLFTDLPMRQIHYFGPRWLAENKWVDKAGNYSLIMVYNDSHYEAFWRTFDVHHKVSRAAAVEKAEHPKLTLGLRPEQISGSDLSFWSPGRLEKWRDTKKSMKKADLSQIDKSHDDLDDCEVRHRMEEKVRAQLSEIHDYEVPMALGGVYRDWSVDGGWHTWEPFVDVPSVKKVLLQPFCDDGALKICPCGDSKLDEWRIPLYICGEAFAWEQGWIEGALMTAERVAEEIAGGDYQKPGWFKEDSSGFDKYMYAELSDERRRAIREHTKA